ncbi:MAG: serine/threonine-protein kinase [Gemmataceae bacterium]
MAAPTTSDEFLELVRKSGVVDAARLQAYVEQLRASGKASGSADDMARQLIQDGVITHFQAEQFRAGRWRRFTIGKYKVLERLGAGGMGTVYLCEHMLMKRRVAVKVLPPSKVNDSSSLDRFYREAKCVAALDHPNIVRAYDIDEDDKLHYLVLEHVDGSSLQEIVKKTGPMDFTRAAHYMRQSALGLQHAHETAALVHRDIKPSNILVDRFGVVKILDMGLARFFFDDTDDLTKKFDENVLGTADYLAPEQALDSHGADIRADIYSLGGTFYFCLTGRTPFTDGTVAQKLIWHQTRQPKPIRSFRQDVPDGLIAVLDKMMAKEKGDRYQSPLEVADALEPWTQTEIPPPPEEEMPQFSLAARTPGSMSDSGLSSSSRAAAEKVPPRKPWQPNTASGSRPAVPAPRPIPSPRPPTRSAPRPVGPRSSANGVPAAVAAPDASEAGSADEPLSDLRVSPNKLANIRRRFPAWKELPSQARWGIVGVAGAALLGGLIWLLPGPSGGGPKANPKGPEPLVVSDAPGQSLEAALRKAKDGDRIVVRTDITEASVSLNGKRDLLIEAEAGRKVVWRCPADVPPSTKLLLIGNAPGLTLRGVTLDGGSKAESLVILYGKCPGLTLERLGLRGMQKYGVVVTNCEGTAESPVTFSELTVDVQPGQTGILFDLKPQLQGAVPLNAHFRLRDCTFNGPGRKVGATSPSVFEKDTLRLPPNLTLEIGP